MLTRDDIVFEEDYYAHSHIHSQDEVKESLVELINTFVAELGIKRLDKVIVKKTDFFDTKLGIANYKNYTIVLANNIAFCLADKNARFYQRSLAVLKHELYHFQDFQNLLLNRVLKRISEINDEVMGDFHYWTEFYASYSTFDVYEDDDLYKSFEDVFDKSIPFLTRYGSALSISPEAVLCTGMFSVPSSIAYGIMEYILYRSKIQSQKSVIQLAY